MSTSAERMRALRARRAASIEAGPGAPLRDADDLLAPAVEETIAALKLADGDAAAAQLARRYAKVIDRAQDPAAAIRYLGPLLLKALVALRATPAARSAPAKPGRTTPGRIAQLRAAHAQHPATKRRRAGA